jgi:putative heme iron utilization protein
MSMHNGFEFTRQEVSDITDHMNDDHADALALYARAFCKLSESEILAVKMTGIDAAGIDLSVDTGVQISSRRIAFADTGATDQLNARQEARAVLVEMVRIARSKLESLT